MASLVSFATVLFAGEKLDTGATSLNLIYGLFVFIVLAIWPLYFLRCKWLFRFFLSGCFIVFGFCSTFILNVDCGAGSGRGSDLCLLSRNCYWIESHAICSGNIVPKLFGSIRCMKDLTHKKAEEVRAACGG